MEFTEVDCTLSVEWKQVISACRSNSVWTSSKHPVLFMLIFWSSWGVQSGGKGQEIGRRVGSWTMTMHITPSSQCSSFWQRTTFQPAHSNPVLQILLHVTIALPMTQYLAQRSSFCIPRRNSTECDSRSYRYARRGFLKYFPATAGLLQQASKSRKEVTWEWLS